MQGDAFVRKFVGGNHMCKLMFGEFKEKAEAPFGAS